jgi:hypothetical protein
MPGGPGRQGRHPGPNVNRGRRHPYPIFQAIICLRRDCVTFEEQQSGKLAVCQLSPSHGLRWPSNQDDIHGADAMG